MMPVCAPAAPAGPEWAPLAAIPEVMSGVVPATVSATSLQIFELTITGTDRDRWFRYNPGYEEATFDAVSHAYTTVIESGTPQSLTMFSVNGATRSWLSRIKALKVPAGGQPVVKTDTYYLQDGNLEPLHVDGQVALSCVVTINPAP